MTLLLVSPAYVPSVFSWTLSHWNIMNHNAYDGVSVPMVACQSSYMINETQVGNIIYEWNTYCNKDIWPLVCLNRIVGADKPYFKDILGIDLWDDAGALSDLYKLFEYGLTIAKETGSPGVCIDPEFYHNYEMYRISNISTVTGKKWKVCKARLIEIGKELAEIVNNTYPEAKIWWYWGGLFGGETFRAPSYVLLGLLDKKSQFTCVAGGHIYFEPCVRALCCLNDEIEIRGQDYAPMLEQFPSLSLGGRVNLWIHRNNISGVFLEYECCTKSNIINYFGFEKPIRQLLERYGDVFIYAAEQLGYNPWDEPVGLTNMLRSVKK